MGKLVYFLVFILFLLIMASAAYHVIIFLSQVEQLRVEYQKQEIETFVPEELEGVVVLQKCLKETNRKLGDGLTIAREKRSFREIPGAFVDYFEQRSNCFKEDPAD